MLLFSRAPVIAAFLSTTFVPLPVVADDAGRLIGGILGAIVNEQARQRQQQPVPGAQQQRSTRQPVQQQTQKARQPSAPRLQQPALSLTERRAVQRALAQSGFYQGEIDGDLGPASRKAIAQWQSSVGAAATGYLLARQAATLSDLAPPEPVTPPDAQYAGDATGASTAAALFPEGGTTPPGLSAADDTVSSRVLAEPDMPYDSPDAMAGADPDAEGTIPGEERLHAALLFWGLSQKPDLVWNNRLSGLYRTMPFLPGGEAPPRNVTPQALVPLVELGLDYHGAHPPQGGVVDVRVLVARDKPDPNAAPGPAKPSYANLFQSYDGIEDIDGVPALTRIVLRSGNDKHRMEFRLDKPFFLPVPDDYKTAWSVPENARIKPALRVELGIADPVAVAEASGNLTVDAAVTVRKAALVLIPSGRLPQGELPPTERVLREWDQAAPAAAPTNADKPATAAEIAAIYGVEVHGERVLLPNGLRRSTQSRSAAQASLLGRSEGGFDTAAVTRLDRAIRLAALIEADPERALDPGLADMTRHMLLSDRDRVELFPMDMAMEGRGGGNAMTELAKRSALEKADPEMRARIARRAPALPLALRSIIPARMGEYDFDAGGFPLYYDFSGSVLSPDLGFDGSPGSAAAPFFKADRAQAEALLARLDAAGGGTRQMSLVVDSQIDAAKARPGATGPITEAQIDTVTVMSSVLAMAFYADAAASVRLRDVDVPARLAPRADPTADLLPDDVYMTTGQSLMAAVAVRDPDAVESGALDSPELSNLSDADRMDQAQAYRAALPGLARDSYWIGAAYRLGPYSADQGGFPVEMVDFRTAPHQPDVHLPLVAPQNRDDFQVLRVSAQQAAQVSDLVPPGQNLTAYVKVPVVDAGLRDGQPHIAFGPAQEIIIGPQDRNGGFPQTVALRLTLAAPDRLAALAVDPAAPVTAPETLVLDREGIDLLALATQPDLYDDDAYRRMMVERLLKEKAGLGASGPKPAWGQFFADPRKPYTADQLEVLLPSFRDWTAARLAALPALVTLPVSSPHPDTQCRGMRELRPDDPDRRDFVSLNAAVLAGADFVPPATALEINRPRPRPGPDRIWGLQPERSSQKTHCVAGTGDDFVPEDAAQVGFFLQVQAQPDVARTAEQSVLAASYVLSRDRIAIQPVEGLTDVPPGVVGVLTLRAQVERVETFGTDPNGGGVSRMALLEKGAWDSFTATPPAALDIVGLALGASLAEFEAGVTAHLSQPPVIWRTAQPGKGLFRAASGYVAPDGAEALLAVYAPDTPQQTVIAVLRRMEFAKGAVTRDGLKTSLEQKYGPITEANHDGGPPWHWGALPIDEDHHALCGGRSTVNMVDANQLPRLVRDGAEAAPDAMREGERIWRGVGWPAMVEPYGDGAVPDPARCGPVVSVNFQEYDDKAVIVTWLSDRKLAEELAQPPAPIQVEIKF